MIAQSGNITLKDEFCTDGFYYILSDEDDSFYFKADTSLGWETMRHAYAMAAQAFNRLVPENDVIPCF